MLQSKRGFDGPIANLGNTTRSQEPQRVRMEKGVVIITSSVRTSKDFLQVPNLRFLHDKVLYY